MAPLATFPRKKNSNKAQESLKYATDKTKGFQAMVNE